MTEELNIEYFNKKGLLPYQSEFAYNFLISTNKPIWELVSPTGLGKTHLSAILIAQILEKNPRKRVLILSPRRYLLSNWESVLSSELQKMGLNVTPLIVNIKTFFELQSIVKNETLWPMYNIILMTTDLAKRKDVLLDLTNVVWDLIIFDESHLLTKGQRKALFECLTSPGVFHKALLLTPIPGEPISTLVNQVRIQLSDVIDIFGEPIYSFNTVEWNYINYQRSNEEVTFLDKVEEFVRQLANNWSYGTLLVNVLLQAASSSVYTLEESLLRLLDVWQNLRNKISHNMTLTDDDINEVRRKLKMISDDLGLEQELSQDVSIASSPQKFLMLYQNLESLLEQIDEIKIDSKINALVSHLKENYDEKIIRHICIWSSYSSTISYIGSFLSDLNLPVYSISQDLDLFERRNVLGRFEQDGGILLTTDVLSTGISLTYVIECINYDLPINPIMLEQRLGRFARLGRERNFKMTLLNDVSKSLSWEENNNRLIEKTFLIRQQLGSLK